MTISLNNGLIGLSVLGGSTAYSSYLSTAASTESPAVIAAKKAFTTPATTPPWQDAAEPSGATSAQVAAIKRLATIIEASSDSTLEDLPDVQTAFTAYKALENLRILAEAGTSKTISDTERASLQKSFAKGLTQLQSWLGTADTDLLTLAFGNTTSSTRTLGVEARYATSAMVGAVRGMDPLTGHHFDATKRYIEATPYLSEEDRRQVYEGNARRVFPRLDAVLRNQGR